MKTGKDLIAEFLFELQVINPIEIIIRELENRSLRQSDLKFLDSKLNSFMNLAAKTYYMNIDVQEIDDNKPAFMNGYGYAYYEKYFKLLLTYFKTYDK